jgi:nucleoside-diphosphate-sugar epimerase
MSAGQMTRALVIGGSGAIGSAIAAQLRDAQVQVVTLSRQSTPPLDLCDENSVQQAALALRDQAPFQLIIHAAGVLHTPDAMPEKNSAICTWRNCSKLYDQHLWPRTGAALFSSAAG